MKRLSLYLFLILFTLQTPSQADDIRDFQIEGMSIGDSLLDYFSEGEIKKAKEKMLIDGKRIESLPQSKYNFIRPLKFMMLFKLLTKLMTKNFKFIC